MRPNLSIMLCAILSFAGAGCALTTKSTPIMARYFSPEEAEQAKISGAEPARAKAELRLGRVDGASHLEERLVYRDSAHELGYYEDRRWTESPDEYLKRGLARVLFEERGIRRVVGGPAPTLEAELVAFEEVRGKDPHAHVQVVVRLQDSRVVRWEETLTVDRPLPAGQGAADATVAALGEALRTVLDRIADRVTRELEAPPAPTATADASRP